MPIRNRLISLLYRLVIFGIEIYTLILLFTSDYQPAFPAQSLAFFGTEALLLSTIITGLEIIFNSVDLSKHGVNGLSAYVWMPLTLGMVSFVMGDALCYAVTSPFFGGFGAGSDLLRSIMAHLVVPVLVFLDYLLFDEKGTVKWSHPIYWLFYPIFYFAFSMSSHFLFGTDFYPYPFLNNDQFLNRSDFLAGNNGWNGVFMTLALIGLLFIGMGFLLVFLNNLLSGKYKRHFSKTN
jgi:hypothetical protein